MWSFFEIRQGKKQPVCRLCRKALVYKVGTASISLVHMQSSGKLTKKRSESASEVIQRKESTDLDLWMCSSRKWHAPDDGDVDFRPSKVMRHSGRLHHMEWEPMKRKANPLN